MKNPFGHLIRRLFGFSRPEPASSALMVGSPFEAPEPRRDDQDLLRRAMQAASEPELPTQEELVEPSRHEEQLTSPRCDEPITTEADEELAVEAASIDEVQRATADSGEEISLPAEAGSLSLEAAEVESAEPHAVDNAEDVSFDGDTAHVDAALVDAPDSQPAPEEEEILATEEALEAPTLQAEEKAPLPEEEDEPLQASAQPQSDVKETLAAELANELESEPQEVVAPKKRTKKAAAPRKRKTAAKPKKPVEADALADVRPEDDVWVSDAVVWSLSGYWLAGDWSPPANFDGSQRLEEFRELAASGKLTIWGRSDDAAVWQPIDPAYWKSGVVEPTSLAEGRENVVAEPKPSKAKGKAKARKYSALKVSRAQVEELWRPGAMH